MPIFYIISGASRPLASPSESAATPLPAASSTLNTSSAPVYFRTSSTATAATTAPNTQTQNGSRSGRRPKFSSEEDLIILREVSACKSHMARTGKKPERFEVSAAKFNGTKNMSSRVTWKTLQDS